MSTVNGAVGGQNVTFTNSSATAANFAQSIFSNPKAQAFTGGAVSPASGFFATSGNAVATVTGVSAVTIGLLAGQGGVFQTGQSQASLVVAGDNTNSTVSNNNQNGSLIAFTGAGGNALQGAGLINGFQTGVGGQDAIAFASSQALQVNALTSLGQDTVSVFGNPGGTQVNSITALQNGSDNVTLNNGGSLTFVNLSTATSTVTGSAGSTVTIGGTGNTVAVSTGGTETFNVLTSTGNVTLVGGTGADSFNFVTANASALSGSTEVVANFASNDSVHLSGYGANGYVAAQSVNGSTVLTLSDNTKVIFAGIADTTQVTSRITSA